MRPRRRGHLGKKASRRTDASACSLKPQPTRGVSGIVFPKPGAFLGAPERAGVVVSKRNHLCCENALLKATFRVLAESVPAAEMEVPQERSEESAFSGSSSLASKRSQGRFCAAEQALQPKDHVLGVVAAGGCACMPRLTDERDARISADLPGELIVDFCVPRNR